MATRPLARPVSFRLTLEALELLERHAQRTGNDRTAALHDLIVRGSAYATAAANADPALQVLRDAVRAVRAAEADFDRLDTPEAAYVLACAERTLKRKLANLLEEG